eukprot:1135431-Pleurochrysis_carterae.AAC.5
MQPTPPPEDFRHHLSCAQWLPNTPKYAHTHIERARTAAAEHHRQVGHCHGCALERLERVHRIGHA